MALNNLGLGFVITGKSLAKAAFTEVNAGLYEVADNAAKTADKMGRLRDEQGRYLRRERDALVLDGDAIGKSMRNVGAVVAAAGAAISLLLGIATSKATEFGAGIAEVSTLVDEAQFHVKDLNNETLSMAATYGGELKTQIKGIYQGISAGAADAKSSTNLLNAANKLAIGGVTDVSTAVDGLTNVLNSYSLSYDHATEVSDAFFVALKSGKTTAAELSSTVGQLAPTAGAVGVGFQEMLGAISAVTTKGLNTAAAVTGLKAALANVIKPTSEAAAEAQRLGIHFDAATLRAKGLPAFLDQITSSAKFNKDSMAKLFGSIEGLNAIMALTSGNSETFKTILASMATSAGQTDAAFQKMSETAAFQDRRLAALKETALVLIGQAILPLSTFATKVANVLLVAFTRIPGPMRNFLVVGVAVGAAVAVVTGTVVGLVGAFMLLDTAILPALIAIGALWTLLLAAAVPMSVIGLGIYGLYVAFEKNLGGIGTKLRDFYDRMSLIWEGLGQLFSDGGFSGKVRDELNKTQNAGLKQFLIEVFTFAARIEELFTGIGRGFEQGLGRASPIFEALGNAFTRLGSAIAHVFGGENDPQKKADAFRRFGNAGESVGNALEKVVNILTTAFTYVTIALAFFFELLGSMRKEFGFAWDQVTALTDVFGDLIDAFTGGNPDVDTTSAKFMAFAAVLAVGVRNAAVFIGVIAWMIRNSLAPLAAYIDLVRTSWERLKAALSGGGIDALVGLGERSKDGSKKGDSKVKSLAIGGLSDNTGSGSSPAVAEATASAARPGSETGGNDLLAALTAALGAKKPDQVTIPVMLDGDKIGEAIANRQSNGGVRSFQPGPAAQ